MYRKTMFSIISAIFAIGAFAVPLAVIPVTQMERSALPQGQTGNDDNGFGLKGRSASPQGQTGDDNNGFGLKVRTAIPQGQTGNDYNGWGLNWIRGVF